MANKTKSSAGGKPGVTANRPVAFDSFVRAAMSTGKPPAPAKKSKAKKRKEKK